MVLHVIMKKHKNLMESNNSNVLNSMVISWLCVFVTSLAVACLSLVAYPTLVVPINVMIIILFVMGFMIAIPMLCSPDIIEENE